LVFKDPQNREINRAIKEMRKTKEPYLNKEYILGHFENLKQTEERINELYQNIE